ncbi:hypothetical protein Ocin01_09614 [Orchesella cincta]|uniref:Uncharacterized protein n=1 Tax=Orchesella cincta TaxID=48709 RepID=A0A1D2MVH9_ORCCI|nr:hypothetical protein Ocin01_09614 [Orchesella cincta]
MKLAGIVLVIGCACVCAVAQRQPKITELGSLSIPQKLVVLAASNLDADPRRQIKWTDLFSEDDKPDVDVVFTDIRSLLTLSRTIPEEAGILPEVDWYFSWGGCWFGWCFDQTMILTSNDTIITGQKDVTSVNEVTPTSFKNTFHSPAFAWHSPNCLFNLTNHLENITDLYRDFYFTITNLTLVSSLNYEYVPDLGIQVSNLSVEFGYGHMVTNIEDVTKIRGDGSVEIRDPIKNDLTFYFDKWEDYKTEFIPSFEFRINCLLSGSRNDPARCDPEEEDEYISREYYKMNLIHLIETIGLGALDRNS